MEPFKETLGLKPLSRFAQILEKIEPQFDRRAFERAAAREIPGLELKPRAQWVAQALNDYLPGECEQKRQTLVELMRDPALADQYGFIFLPLSEWIAMAGSEDFAGSVAFMEVLTEKFTAEFCVRPMIVRYPEAMQKQLLKWARSSNPHWRRLASEGSRPLLPWGQKLAFILEDPGYTLPILEQLKADSSESVRKSVANHLNVYSKHRDKWVVALLKRWQQEDSSPERQKLVKHALRTLIKQGHAQALKLIGVERVFVGSAKLKVTTPQVKLGEALHFELKILPKSRKPLLVDYVIYHVKADGSLSPKVFKWTRVQKPDVEITLKKKHKIIPITTRKYYSGQHRVAVLLNGVEQKPQSFHLIIEGKK